jgi:hypothetical protein
MQPEDRWSEALWEEPTAKDEVGSVDLAGASVTSS